MDACVERKFIIFTYILLLIIIDQALLNIMYVYMAIT